MEIYETVWTLVESMGFLLVIVIFFMDPVRRWNFFGYRPTAVMGLYDPRMGKVLLSKVNGAWSFNQGGMYENNIYSTVKDILLRELGLRESRFKLVYTRPLGKIRIDSKQVLLRARISTISLFPHLRGKGFLACFIRTDMQGIEAEIKLGAGIQECVVVDIPQARELVRNITTDEHNPRKQEVILRMLAELESYMRGVKAWEEEHLRANPDRLEKPDKVGKADGEKKESE